MQKSILNDTKGSLAIPFALLSMVLVGLAGVAIDYGRFVSAEMKMQGAIDTTALRSRLDLESRPDVWKTNAESMFKLQTQDIDFVKPPVITPTSSSSAGSVHLLAEASLKPIFASLFGITELKVSVESTTKMVKSYARVTFLIDASHSMGIGATTADQDRMVAATDCAIACHYSDPWTLDNYDAIRASGATLRIDVIKDAVAEFITRTSDTAPNPDFLEVAVYTFGNRMEQLVAPTTDYTQALTEINKIDLPKDPAYLGTNISRAISNLADDIQVSGSGRSPDDRKSIVIILTDGIENDAMPEIEAGTLHITKWVRDSTFVNDDSISNNIQSPSTGLCKPLQDKSHEIHVARIKYITPTSGFMSSHNREKFEYVESTLNDLSEQRLRECTTNGLYLTANDSHEIESTLETISAKITKPVDLYVAK